MKEDRDSKRQIDRDRQTGEQTDREGGREGDRQVDRQTEKNARFHNHATVLPPNKPLKPKTTSSRGKIKGGHGRGKAHSRMHNAFQRSSQDHTLSMQGSTRTKREKRQRAHKKRREGEEEEKRNTNTCADIHTHTQKERGRNKRRDRAAKNVRRRSCSFGEKRFRARKK